MNLVYNSLLLSDIIACFYQPVFATWFLFSGFKHFFIYKSSIVIFNLIFRREGIAKLMVGYPRLDHVFCTFIMS